MPFILSHPGKVPANSEIICAGTLFTVDTGWQPLPLHPDLGPERWDRSETRVLQIRC